MQDTGSLPNICTTLIIGTWAIHSIHNRFCFLELLEQIYLYPNGILWILHYKFHQKKVYTCAKGTCSKARGTSYLDTLGMPLNPTFKCKLSLGVECTSHFIHTVSPKRKYTLLPSWVLKIEEGQMKGRGCAKPTIELVLSGPSLILKFKEMAAHQQKPWRDPL